MKLYKIDSNDVLKAINLEVTKTNFRNKYEFIANSHYAKKYKFPLKIVLVLKDQDVLIITVYPIKKGNK